MKQLFNKMRELSLNEQKKRRQEIFERTRRIFQGYDESEAESECPEQEFNTCNSRVMEMQKVQQIEQVLSPSEKKKKDKKCAKQNRIRKYWRKLLQVSDWMIQVPNNLKQFYVATRPDALKSLLVFQKNHILIRDKGGKSIFETQINTKAYDGTIIEVYFIKQKSIIIIADLIVWKGNPMSSCQFQFRATWIFSNFNLVAINQHLKNSSFQFLQYFPCDINSIKKLYIQTPMSYEKEGLIFVHKDSFYIHGVNSNVLSWKDKYISKYFEAECAENKIQTKGIGRVYPEGVIKTLDEIPLFTIDIALLPKYHNYIKFKFTEMLVDQHQNTENQIEQTVRLIGLQIIQPTKYVYSYVDSLSKLAYKSNLKKSNISFQDILNRITSIETENMHQ